MVRGMDFATTEDTVSNEMDIFKEITLFLNRVMIS